MGASVVAIREVPVAVGAAAGGGGGGQSSNMSTQYLQLRMKLNTDTFTNLCL